MGYMSTNVFSTTDEGYLRFRELLEEENISVKIADAPIVEGAVAAAVEANCGSSLEDVIRAAEETRDFRKL